MSVFVVKISAKVGRKGFGGEMCFVFGADDKKGEFNLKK